MTIDLSEYRNQFINAAKLQDESIKRGDSKTANRQYDILTEIFIKAQKDPIGAKEFYRNLREENDANVKEAACAHSLALGLDIAEAETILAALARDETIGITALNAEMTLKVWKKQGYLKF